MTSESACRAKKDNGQPSRAPRLRDSEFCFWHSPEHAEEAAEAQRLGGLRRRREEAVSGAYDFDGLQDVAQVQRLLEIACVPVCPDWGKGYDILPDDQTDQVESLKKARHRAWEAISRSPTSPIQEALEASVGRNVTERQERWEEAMAALREQLREGVPWCWQEVRAVETLLEEVAVEFDGEDPLLPPVRNVLDKAHQELAELPAFLGAIHVEVELPEPDEERVDVLRQRLLRQDE